MACYRDSFALPYLTLSPRSEMQLQDLTGGARCVSFRRASWQPFPMTHFRNMSALTSTQDAVESATPWRIFNGHHLCGVALLLFEKVISFYRWSDSHGSCLSAWSCESVSQQIFVEWCSWGYEMFMWHSYQFGLYANFQNILSAFPATVLAGNELHKT
jgi:hypothetical protein